MRKKLSLFILAFLAGIGIANACTNFLVGKDASTDGSTFVTYSADSYWLYGALYHYPAATHAKGEKLKVNEWDTGKYLGEIDQVEKTYNVIGNMNEHQLTIGETTFTGRPELIDTTGLIDYGSLIYITLQRAKNAREAIVTMIDLVNRYGYYSSGESFSIADPNEVWIMELIGKGPGVKGAVWVARRIPDDCISAHANQARITTFPLESRKDKSTISSKNIKKIYRPEVTTVYAHDVITFAREKGYYTGEDKDFSFSDTYNPLDFGGVRFCEARVWSFFRRCDPSMERYLSYILCETKERMPLWIKPAKKISARDLMEGMRDHYEGTPLDMSIGMGAGPHNSVYRMTPLTYKYRGEEFFHERPVGTQQTGFTFVAQMRSFIPNPVGGVLWFGVDDATCNLYVPMYASMTKVPESFSSNTASLLDFSWKSAFWVNNWVAQMVYNRYSELMPEVAKRQEQMEGEFYNELRVNDRRAIDMLNSQVSMDKVVEFLTKFSNQQADNALRSWQRLGQYLMVKYLDGTVKGEKNGRFEQNEQKVPQSVKRPGYPEEYIENVLVRPNPNRFRVKSAEEMERRK